MGPTHLGRGCGVPVWGDGVSEKEGVTDKVEGRAQRVTQLSLGAPSGKKTGRGQRVCSKEDMWKGSDDVGWISGVGVSDGVSDGCFIGLSRVMLGREEVSSMEKHIEDLRVVAVRGGKTRHRGRVSA